MAQIWSIFEKTMFTVITAGLVGLIVYQSPQWYATLFPGIQRVHIEGDFIHIDRLHIEKAIDQAVSGGFFEIDPVVIGKSMEHINWVKDVWIYRVWPRTLSIVVEERKPLAQWGESALLDEEAEIFSPEQVSVHQLPIILGAPERAKILLNTLQLMNQRLADLDLAIRLVQESDRQSLRLVLNNGWALQLGRQHWNERLGRFAAVYQIVLDNASSVGLHSIQCLDFRYPGSFAISQNKQECYQ